MSSCPDPIEQDCFYAVLFFFITTCNAVQLLVGLFIFSIAWQTTQWLAVPISGNSDWNNPTGHGLIVYTGHLISRND